jgi:hypothetical protein
MATQQEQITAAILQNALSPNSTSADGVSVTNNPISEQIAGLKFLAANDALSQIAAGTGFFTRVQIIPPSARGNSIAD